MKCKWIKRFSLVLCFLSFFNTAQGFSQDKIRIVTTTATFESIARSIAGDSAEIYSIASPNQNIHFITPTPKDVLMVKKADVLIHGGLDLEAWRGPLLDAAGKPELMWPNGERQIDVSQGVPLLEIPASLSRSEGDIHAYGNPHYWTDPENGKIIAGNIAAGLARLYPKEAAVFEANLKRFTAEIEEHEKQCRAILAPYEGAPVVSYHKSLVYFLKRFGLESVGELEPKPGIPPTAKHLAALEQRMRERQVKVILQEPFDEKRTARLVAEATGAGVVEFLSEAGISKDASDYVSVVDRNVKSIARVLEKSRGSE